MNRKAIDAYMLLFALAVAIVWLAGIAPSLRARSAEACEARGGSPAELSLWDSIGMVSVPCAEPTTN